VGARADWDASGGVPTRRSSLCALGAGRSALDMRENLRQLIGICAGVCEWPPNPASQADRISAGASPAQSTTTSAGRRADPPGYRRDSGRGRRSRSHLHALTRSSLWDGRSERLVDTLIDGLLSLGSLVRRRLASGDLLIDPTVTFAPSEDEALANAANADVIVVVVGELAYAEGVGDNPAPALPLTQIEIPRRLQKSNGRVHPGCAHRSLTRSTVPDRQSRSCQ
jgi:hypothetical protein